MDFNMKDSFTKEEFETLKRIATYFWENKFADKKYIKEKVDEVNKATCLKDILNVLENINEIRYLEYIKRNNLDLYERVFYEVYPTEKKYNDEIKRQLEEKSDSVIKAFNDLDEECEYVERRFDQQEDIDGIISYAKSLKRSFTHYNEFINKNFK